MKRPKYIEQQLGEINKVFRQCRLKFDDKYKNDLFVWFTTHLSQHGWYRGFNMYVDIIDEHGEVIGKTLAGVDYENMDYYIQIW